MGWYNNMKIGTKLISAFIIVALIAAGIGLVGYISLDEVGNVRLPSVLHLLEAEKYLTEINSYERLLLNPKNTYEERQEAYAALKYAEDAFDRHVKDFLELPWTNEEEALWRRIEAAQQKWSAGHDAFMVLARQFDSIGIDDPVMVEYIIAERERDHYSWIFLLTEAIYNQRAFTGQLDGTRCELGMWIDAFSTRNVQLQGLINSLKSSHTAVHASGTDINGFITGNLANKQVRAREVFDNVTLPNMQSVFGILHDIHELADSADGVFTQMIDQSMLVNTPLFYEMIDLMEELVDLNASLARNSVNSSVIMILLFTVLGAILAVILGVFISNSIKKPVIKLLKAAETIADGDLNVEIDIKTRDEVGETAKAFARMVANVNEIMTQINSSSEQVASGAVQISDSSQALSQGATEQASSIEEISASLEQLSSQTNKNADNANNANNISNQAKSNAEKGNKRMQEMLKSMADINESSAKISKIIKVIDEIAFQTNILALNAAVEAARAGQHGKGFAVVAEEVRNLAARSANAAKETTEMIEGSIRNSETGTSIANETAKALGSIVEDVSNAATIVGDIAKASNEQASGIDQVNQAVNQVSSVIQTNSATSEESAAASEELASLADVLKEQVAKFKLKKLEGGSLKDIKGLSPEVVKMLEEMNRKNKDVKQSSSPSKRIALSDGEFGKY